MKHWLTNNKLLLLLFITGSFFFFELNYRYWYRFVEQFSMFLFTNAYFTDLIKQPGGFNEYSTAFITQFFAIPFIAPVCISLLLGIIVFVFYHFMARCGFKGSIFIAFLPAFLFWLFPVESIASLLAVLTGLITALGYTFIHKPYLRYFAGFVFLSIIYLLAVPAHLLAGALIAVFEIRTGKNVQRFLIAAGALAWSFILPLIAMRTIYIIPMREAYLSKYLFHPEYPVPSSFWYIWFSFPIIALLTFIFPVKKKIFKIEWKNQAALLSLLVIIICSFILYKKHPLEQAYQYDWYARRLQWEKITVHSQKHSVKDKDALVYANMANAYTGRFNEALFSLPQIGAEGFIPHDPRTRLGLIEAGEVAWLVNHTNAAQRFAFIGVLSSERCVQPRLMKRLVETYLVNEEYKAAEKYIKILEQTLFYSDWAKKQRLLLNSETASKTNWIVERRKLNPVTDNPHDLTKSLPQALAFLIDDHSENKHAFEYGMAYLLLYKDLGAFMHYMELRNENKQQLPVLYQEAICLFFTVQKNPEAIHTYNINSEVYHRFTTYIQQSQNLSPALLARQYGDTYYYYAQFVKPPKKPVR